MKKIALEEHFLTPALVPHMQAAMPEVSPEAAETLVDLMLDFGERRLAAMDAAGVDIAVLSISGPGVQAEPDGGRAVKLALQANDALAAEIQKQPARYRGFAHLPMQDVPAAIKELERSVRQLGLVGAMVNGHTHGVYLDDPRYDPFWECLQALDAPLYLHPTDSFVLPYVLQGAPELVKPTWEWNFETSSHFLRLVFSGVFDRFPKLKIILGHMGETMPYHLWRFDSRAALIVGKRPLKEAPSFYLKRNMYVTTSGQFDNVPLLAALSALGTERVLFSIDYPYEDSVLAGRFLDEAPLEAEIREKVARGNAMAVMNIKT
ncbi:amidohydrolase family protein [Aquabacter sp. P-9]|uniref:amidohydrolase family protein n=1 Tax=Aquabacter sediminis TaxID=3029197 RepID=UPI00237E43AD|nr:amidohydrolase family protein [Aquabacter sp. P-9]MDE1568004.1 amidohydrolase family protein [Aquabacter sp. P-9]